MGKDFRIGRLARFLVPGLPQRNFREISPGFFRFAVIPSISRPLPPLH
jgi:hypothetical protein